MGMSVSENLRKTSQPTLGPTLLLLRHGQIRANKRGNWHGSTDSSLTFKGKRQARATGRYLARSEQHIDRVVSSPLQRCQQTAALATRHLQLNIETHPGLAEMSVGDWEDMPFAQLHEEHDLFGTMSRDATFLPPNGESLHTVSERMVTAFDEIASQAEVDEVILIVSHGVAMGAALATLLDGDARRWQDYQVSNCALSELCLAPEPCLYLFNQDSHL